VNDEFTSRIAGAIFGMAVGDALGAPVEFMMPGEISSKHGVLKEMVGGGWLRLKPGQVTDDTDMSLCIARAICHSGKWDLERIAGNFADWLKTRPIDVGDTCRRGIRNYMLHGQLESPPNEWDAGNGALMRMVPVALFTIGNNELLERYTIEQAHLTHNHPLSDGACISYGRMLHMAILGRSKTTMRREADDLVVKFPTFRFDPYKGMATGYVVDTFQTVCHYFFRGRNFEECLVRTVNQGGDADTTGAIIGGLAGAYYGMEDIPRRWLKKLDRNLVQELDGIIQKIKKATQSGGPF
jgi:ADP-ribosyl-[dinitrogen reductase] hydrolase